MKRKLAIWQRGLRKLSAEYRALCSTIEREATEWGFDQFLGDPEQLRGRVRDLCRDQGIEYPTAEDIRPFLCGV